MERVKDVEEKTRADDYLIVIFSIHKHLICILFVAH